MFALEFELIELDYCPKCGGVWLDSGELELVGQRAGALQQKLLAALEEEQALRREAGVKRLCPVCDSPLLQVKLKEDHPVVVDRCPRRHGLWFDKGELQAVIGAAGAEDDNLLVQFFKDLDKDNKNNP